MCLGPHRWMEGTARMAMVFHHELYHGMIECQGYKSRGCVPSEKAVQNHFYWGKKVKREDSRGGGIN